VPLLGLFDDLDWDTLIYLMRQSGHLTNYQIAEKFGLTFSAVSQKVGVFKNLLCKNKTLQNKRNRVKSRFDPHQSHSLGWITMNVKNKIDILQQVKSV